MKSAITRRVFQEMNDDEDDEDKYADDMAMPGQKFETKQRITVRNLRIREDTAKVGHYRSLDDLLLVWHAPLGVRSAKRRHQSPEWTILSHSYRLIQ